MTETQFTAETRRACLAALHDYLTPQTWIKGEYESPRGEVCLVGGVRRVTRQWVDSHPDAFPDVDPSLVKIDLKLAIQRDLRAELSKDPHWAGEPLPRFNDARDTALEDVKSLVADTIKSVK